MTIKDIKQLEPLAEVYELQSGLKYIVQIPRLPSLQAEKIAEALRVWGIDCLVVSGDSLKFYILDSK